MSTRIPRRLAALGLGPALAAGLGGCFVLLPGEGGGEARFEPPRQIDPADVALPPGYRIEAIARDLTFPSAVAFDERGRVYVTEAGYSYGDVVTEPRLLRIEEDGARTVVAAGDNPPWTGVVFHQGAFYVTAGHIGPGRILRITPDGRTDVIVDGLPSFGDHFTSGIAVGPDGWLYFDQGTATNSGVVDMSSFAFGWPYRHPDFHDIPCEDITLAGKDFRMPNKFGAEPDHVYTGAYVPYGERTERGQVIPGEVPCTGAVMRVRPDGTGLELVAWGFRNPYGMAFGADGALYATENQYDVRGARPVFGTGDLLWKVERGRWYGWPDYWAGKPLTLADWFEPPGGPAPEFLLLEHPDTSPPRPVAYLGVHSSSNGLDIDRTGAFGYPGSAFIAQFGDMAPAVGKVLDPVGFKVVRVDLETGVIHDFAVNEGETNGPASWLDTGGLERPLGLKLSPDGRALYLADFGVMTTRGGTIAPRPNTGVLWRITRTEGGAP